MITQAQINEMNGPQLVAWYNEHAPARGKTTVKKFRDLQTARDTVYSFAYLYDLLSDTVLVERPVEEETAEGVTAPSVTLEETFDGATPLAERLKLRDGTNKAKAATVLVENLGAFVTTDLLAQRTYGSVDAKGKLIMVVKGVKVALERYAPEYEIRTSKGAVGLFPVE